jgi:LysM repeat protein/RNA polymerase subunit RPABC4/transcription elongation factor Spt4
MPTCRNCGAPLAAQEHTCPVCGAERTARLPRCRRCGGRLQHGLRRCPICGATVAGFGTWLLSSMKVALAIVVGAVLGGSFLFVYAPQVGLPQPAWPTATPTVTATPTMTPLPTRTRYPTYTSTPTLSPTPVRLTYTVQSGDTLSDIADRFHVSIADIMRANNLGDRDFIREGQILIIPQSTPTVTPTP